MKASVNESPAEIQSFRISMEDVCRRSLFEAVDRRAESRFKEAVEIFVLYAVILNGQAAR